MKNISILVPESSVMQATADPQYLFSAVNQFSNMKGHPPAFQIRLVGIHKVVSLNNGTFSVKTDIQLDDPIVSDLVIIPALFGDLEQAVEVNSMMVPWIKNQYERGAEIASLCVGAFLLAATGLLDGKKCSTHWLFADEFRARYPKVSVLDGAILTEENRIYTSGGANSYWSLLLHLVEKYTNREMAILASKYFAIDIDRDSQTSFMIFKGQKSHKDNEMLLVQNYIEAHVDEKMSVDKLAALVSLGRRSFERRFKIATNNTVLEYIQRVKIESAKRQYEASQQNISEVMFNVGYTDSKAFRSTFKKITGLTPAAYRSRYNKLPM